jgi:hypothetical protein
MICPPCADFVDRVTRENQRRRVPLPLYHDPEICRDAHWQQHGCACAHGVEEAAR